VTSYDYVIVGAGSAGCVLASRLSAADARVLLLEAGGSERRLTVRAPGAFPKQFQSAIDWNYLSEPEPGLHGRRLYLPRGKMLGGSSSMNAMLYVRGNRADYDRWASEHGAQGWSYDEVLPLFKRAEHHAEIHDAFHGTGGELYVSYRRWLSRYCESFLDSAVSLGAERNADYNGATQDGAGLFQVNVKNGKRWQAASAFLRPAMGRENLDVVTAALVRRVTIAGGRAVAVEYEHRGRPVTATCQREIIVTSGAYNSPKLLMLSGIGPAEHLREMGIEPAVDCPNVGQHLQEHPFQLLNWHCRGDQTLDDAAHPRYLLEWLAGRGKLTSTVAEAVWHWRSEPHLPAPDFQLYFAPVYFWEHGFRKTGAPAVTLGVCLVAPESRGSVRLRSADPADHPRIQVNLLSHAADTERILRGVEHVRRLAATGPLARLCGEELNPGAGIRSRDELVAWIRATCEHIYHPTSTCRMGPAEHGVVDAELRVYGVEGLRVADASIMPQITSGNTNAATYMIAERCADLLLGRLPSRADVGLAARAERK
jgi:choline dehydrogenase